MDNETRHALELMEGRLMGRITTAQEVIIERVRACETSIAALVEIARSGNTTMGLIAGMVTDIGRRVTDLEK